MSVTLRSTSVGGVTAKGSPLTYAELDNNFLFTQSGTGASTRTVQAKIREIVSVKDFGATGDGVADDTAEIQAAIDSLPTATPNPGGTVFFPKGIYKISSPITIPDGVVLEGESLGANRSDEQGGCLIDAASTTIGISSTSTFGVGIKRLAVKNATVACIKFTSVQHFVLEDVAALGSSVPTGIHLTTDTYFGYIKNPTISGLADNGAVGLKIDDGSNEHVVTGGCIRQNKTNILVDDANNIRINGVDCEGSSSQTGISIAPTAAADAHITGCRFETLGVGILLGANAKGSAICNWYGSDTLVGFSGLTSQNFLVFEPLLFNAPTPGALAFQMTDALSTGMKFGATTIKNISGGNEITAGSGALKLTTSGGNPVDIHSGHLQFTEVADIAAPAANKGVLYCRDNGSGKGQIVARFPSGAVQVIATEP